MKASQELEMAAVTSVGISRANWQASLNAYFSYPAKDEPLRKLYKEVVQEYVKPKLDELLPSFSEEN